MDSSGPSEQSGGEEGAFRGRSRSRSLYGGDAEHPPQLPPPPSPSAVHATPPPLARKRSQSLRSDSTEGGVPSGAGDSSGSGGSSRRRSAGKLQSRSNSLSRKTLSIVNNLQPQTPSSSRKDKEEAEEERRLALEEKRKQMLGHHHQQQQAYGGGKDAECDYTIRILLLGDSGVGKTSLMHRYSEDAFAMNLLSTAGVDFKVHHTMVDGKRVKCQVWDTAGQEKFHVITRTYYRGAHGIALIYDVTDPDSFKNVNYWMANIQTHADEKVHRVLLGNKTDLPDQRQIQPEQGEAMAREFGIKFFETSAKTGQNVEEGFDALVREVIHRLEAQAQAEEAQAAAPPQTTAPAGKGVTPKNQPHAHGTTAKDRCRIS